MRTIKSPLLNENESNVSSDPFDKMNTTPANERAVPISWNFDKRSFKKTNDNMYIIIGVDEFIKDALIDVV